MVWQVPSRGALRTWDHQYWYHCLYSFWFSTHFRNQNRWSYSLLPACFEHTLLYIPSLSMSGTSHGNPIHAFWALRLLGTIDKFLVAGRKRRTSSQDPASWNCFGDWTSLRLGSSGRSLLHATDVPYQRFLRSWGEPRLQVKAGWPGRCPDLESLEYSQKSCLSYP